MESETRYGLIGQQFNLTVRKKKWQIEIRKQSKNQGDWWVNPRFEKTTKVWRLPAEFPIWMAVDGVLRLSWNFVWERF